jgi:hypothetical protein
MTATTLRAVLQEEGPGVFVELPAEVVDSLAGGKKPAVRLTVNGHTFRVRVAVYGGRFLLGIRRELREKAGIAPGDELELSIELDAEPRTVELPHDLAQWLAAEPEALAAFEALPYTNRKEYVAWVTGAKQATTRARRLAEVPQLLKSGRRTPT